MVYQVMMTFKIYGKELFLKVRNELKKWNMMNDYKVLVLSNHINAGGGAVL